MVSHSYTTTYIIPRTHMGYCTHMLLLRFGKQLVGFAVVVVWYRSQSTSVSLRNGVFYG
jgi:hypothetical protein